MRINFALTIIQEVNFEGINSMSFYISATMASMLTNASNMEEKWQMSETINDLKANCGIKRYPNWEVDKQDKSH